MTGRGFDHDPEPGGAVIGAIGLVVIDAPRRWAARASLRLGNESGAAAGGCRRDRVTEGAPTAPSEASERQRRPQGAREHPVSKRIDKEERHGEG